MSTTQFHIQVVPANNDGPAIDLIVADSTQVETARFTVPAPIFGQGPYVMLPGMSYTWRVRVSDALTPLGASDPLWGPWSEERRIKTPQPSISTLTLVTPANGSTLQDIVTLDLQWQNGASDVFYYEVQTSTDPQFITVGNAVASVWWNLVHGGVTNPPNSWHTPYLQPNTTYYWRVRPRVQGDGTPVSWGPTWHFRTQTTSQTPPQTTSSVSTFEEQTLSLINQMRQTNGLATLTTVGELTTAARLHSADMANRGSMSHTGSDGSNPGDRLTQAGYQWRANGEIVAYGYNSPQAVVDAWMNSLSHREIIITPMFRDLGSGLVYSDTGRAYWTVDFGLRG